MNQKTEIFDRHGFLLTTLHQEQNNHTRLSDCSETVQVKTPVRGPEQDSLNDRCFCTPSTESKFKTNVRKRNESTASFTR